MEALTLLLPIATAGFALLIFSIYVPVIRRVDGHLMAQDKTALVRADFLCMGVITLLYGIIAFWGLGIFTNPQTFCQFEERGQYALVELKQPQDITQLEYYTGLYSGSYRLQFSYDGETWVDQTSMEQSHGDLFKWLYAELLPDTDPVRYVRIIAAEQLYLGEVILYGADGQPISADALIYDAGTAPLFDEQDTVPEEPTYLNSAYFDEIYHARTAYEHIHGVYPYEVSHPPLGKLILSIGIRIFDMTPFGWRCMGTLAGVLMLPFLYILLKKLCGGTVVPACCTAIFAFDFMHYVQTRIATIDTYAVLFIVMMYLFFYLYLCAPRGEGVSKKQWLPYLAASGISFGLGAASKWTCLYAGAGLGVLWLCDRVSRYLRATKNINNKNINNNNNNKNINNTAIWRETWENVGWCLIFFVLIPGLIYYVSYTPYGQAEGMHGLGMYFRSDYLKLVLDNQSFMFSYHSGVDATHPYSSKWYQWVLDIRPILYYRQYYDDGSKSAFGAFVNPMLCWGGLLAMLGMVYRAVRYRDMAAAFIVLGYLAQLLPWMFVERIVFEYHYFPSVVFLTLALGHMFAGIRDTVPYWKPTVYSFTAVSVALFFVFYPVLSGLRVPQWYTTNFCWWMPSYWPF